MKNIEVMFFDLFYTLITPFYEEGKNECTIIGLTAEEWERYAEDDIIYKRRATGQVLLPEKIIEEIVAQIPFNIEAEQKKEILQLRQKRMQQALLQVDHEILNTLHKLKEKGFRFCLISNADVIDAMYWKDSPLYELFDDAVFSYEAHSIKPERQIYLSAIQKMKISPNNCCFVGDGGSNELYGAKRVGITTVFTEYLEKKTDEKRNEILKYADFHITDFKEIINL